MNDLRKLTKERSHLNSVAIVLRLHIHSSALVPHPLASFLLAFSISVFLLRTISPSTTRALEKNQTLHAGRPAAQVLKSIVHSAHMHDGSKTHTDPELHAQTDVVTQLRIVHLLLNIKSTLKKKKGKKKRERKYKKVERRRSNNAKPKHCQQTGRH